MLLGPNYNIGKNIDVLGKNVNEFLFVYFPIEAREILQDYK